MRGTGIGNPFSKDQDRLYYQAYETLESNVRQIESIINLQMDSYKFKRRDALVIASTMLVCYSARLVATQGDNPFNKGFVNRYINSLVTDIITSALIPDPYFYFRGQ